MRRGLTSDDSGHDPAFGPCGPSCRLEIKPSMYPIGIRKSTSRTKDSDAESVYAVLPAPGRRAAPPRASGVLGQHARSGLLRQRALGQRRFPDGAARPPPHLKPGRSLAWDSRRPRTKAPQRQSRPYSGLGSTPSKKASSICAPSATSWRYLRKSIVSFPVDFRVENA